MGCSGLLWKRHVFDSLHRQEEKRIGGCTPEESGDVEAVMLEILSIAVR